MSTITQILFRRGNDASRQATLLASGEPGVTTDSKRLFVGDGVTAGGNVAGNIIIGTTSTVLVPVGTSYNYSGLSQAAYTALTGAQIGDTIYETSTNILYALSGTPNGSPNANQLYTIATNVTLNPTEFYYGNNSQINLLNQGISGISIHPSAVDQTTLTITSPSNGVYNIAANQGSATTGITNNNLQYAPANSVKGNFTSTTNAITDQVFLTGTNVYQFLGTASNTGLGVIGLSAGQNISFTTIQAVESNGQTLTAVVIDSTPNIESGDGVSFNYDANTGSYKLHANNSLQYLRTSDLWYNTSVSSVQISTGDGTVLPTLNMPYLNSGITNIASLPAISFEAVAPVPRTPAVTVYWTTTGTGGYNVTVFANNSSFKPTEATNGSYNTKSPRGPLFPSYWNDYSWTTSRKTTKWIGGKANTSIVYTTNTILANWPATINCMYLSGTRLWIGGNFMNLGPTTTQHSGSAVRHGIALVDLLSGGTSTITSIPGYFGGVATLSAPVITQGLNILNSGQNTPVGTTNASTPGYGLTQPTPGFSVNQITPYNSLLCLGGCWGPTGTTQPTTSLALFDTTNNYNLSGYTFQAFNPTNASSVTNQIGYVPATITSLVSAGSFLYVAGNFTRCGIAGATGWSATNCAGLTRIKLSNCNTGTGVDSYSIGQIDDIFTNYISKQMYKSGFTPQTVWKYPIICLDAVPNLSGGYILYAGGKHWVQYGNQTAGNYRYQNLTTHWIGNTALASADGQAGINGATINGQDGTLTSFNSIVNGPVNVVAHNQFSTNYNVYVAGKFSSFTSARLQSQKQLIPCNNIFALDTTGYQAPLTTNSGSLSTDNGNNGILNGAFVQGSEYTSPNAPLPILNWFPVFDDEITGVDFHEATTANPISAIYCTGKFTAVGTTKVSHAAAIILPAAGSTNFVGLYPAQWYPNPNAPFTNKGGKGTNILRIPTTSPLSGVLLAGSSSFNTVNNNIRPGWARVTGLNETLNTTTSAISAVTLCAASNVLGQGNYINIDTSFVVSLSDPVIGAYTVNAATFGPKSFPALINIHRGDLCRFSIFRPGNNISLFNSSAISSGIIPDTYNNNIQILGVKLDWDTGLAADEYPYNGFESTVYAPITGTAS